LAVLPKSDGAYLNAMFLEFEGNAMSSLQRRSSDASLAALFAENVDPTHPVTYTNDPQRGSSVAVFAGDGGLKSDPIATGNAAPNDYEYPFIWSQYNFAVGFWFKTSSSGLQYLVDNRTPTNLGRDWSFLTIENGDISARFTTDYASCEVALASTGAGLADGHWHHVVWVRSARRAGALYIDNVKVAEATRSCSANGSDPRGPFYIGSNQGTSNFFSGAMDNFYTIIFPDATTIFDASDVNAFFTSF